MNRNIRRNPVAQAIMKKKLADAILLQKTKLYLTERGESIEDVLIGIAMTLSMLAYSAKLDPKVGSQAPLARVVEGGLSACKQCIEHGWDPVQARPIDIALDAATKLNNLVRDKYVLRAYLELSQ
jgi:hypothetical protein